MNPSEFIELIESGTEEVALKVLEKDPALATSISDKDGPLHGATALHWAAHRNYQVLTQRLIDNGADVNAKACKWGNHSSPLQWAADAGKAQTTEILLRNGAEVDYHEGNGHTALHCCAWGGSSGGSRDPEGYAETAKVLLAAGFDKNGPGKCVSALTMALHVKNTAVASVLEDAGASHVYDDPKIREWMKDW